jgi:hypothetical protein
MDSAWVRWRDYPRWRSPFLASLRDTPAASFIIDGERGPTDTDKLGELLFLQAGEPRAAGADRGPKIKYWVPPPTADSICTSERGARTIADESRRRRTIPTDR